MALEQPLTLGSFIELAHSPETAQKVERLRTIYRAMTPDEQADPRPLTVARRQQVADAAGVEPMEVSQLIRTYLSATRAIAQVSAADRRDASKS